MRKRYVAILFTTVAFVIVIGYTLLPELSRPQSAGYTLTVKVIDSSTGYPLSGVNVTIDNSTTAETDSDGLAKFYLPPDNHVISLQGDGYISKSFTVELSSDNLVTLDIVSL